MDGDKRSFLSSASLVGALTLFSRLLGVVRDSAVARVLGDSVFNDIFNMAFQIPNLARRVLGEGALSAFIVPVYHAEERAGGRERAFLFFNRALTAMILLGGVLTVAGMLASQPLFIAFGGLKFAVIGGEAGAEYLRLGADLTRIMFPYLLVLTLVSMFMGVCHANRRFFSPTLGSSAINVVIIVTAWLAAPQEATGQGQAGFTRYLAWAVIGGVVLRLAIMFPTLRRLGWRFQWASRLRDPAMRSLLLKMGAATFATAVAEINIAVNLVLANFCGQGSVTYLYYSNRLIQFPLAFLVAAMATALVPSISQHYIAGRYEEARSLGRFAVRALMVLMFPAMVGFWVAGEPILALIFQRGQWSAGATMAASAALSMYAVALLPMALVRLLVPIYYAKGDVMTPVKVSAGALVVNLVANLILMRFGSYAGLALGSGIAALFNAWMLWRLLRRDIGSLWEPRLGAAIVKCAIAAGIMGAACWLLLRGWEAWAPPTGFLLRFVQVAVVCGFGAAVYFAAAFLLRLQDLREAVRMFRARRRAS